MCRKTTVFGLASVSPGVAPSRAQANGLGSGVGITPPDRRYYHRERAMRIAFTTAGAAGMYCGSCMRDNTLVTALRALGHDALLIPAYMPIKVDEPDASQKRVFFGGINIYLEQKFWLFRHTPRFLDRLFNFRWLLKWVSRFAVGAKYSDQGALTISMLQGTHGKQAKEVAELVGYLKDENPDVVLFTNALLS